MKKLLLLTCILYNVFTAQAQVVTTLAGQYMGFADGANSNALFYNPHDVAVDANGIIYVADSNNHKIRKITPDGVVSTFAGSTQGFADGAGSAAKFNQPKGIAVDKNGNVYIADTNNYKIRKITPNGIVSTLADSNSVFVGEAASMARFGNPYGVAVDAIGNVYVADQIDQRIRKISPNGIVTTLAGYTQVIGFADGAGSVARFSDPMAIAVDSNNNVYVADRGNNKIRKITPEGVVSTFAGSSQGYADGIGSAAQFYMPEGVTVDANNNVYVSDSGNHKIRKIAPNGVVTTIAGSGGGYADGTGSGAMFYYPRGVAVDGSGALYVADYNNNRIRKITLIPCANQTNIVLSLTQPTCSDDRGSVTITPVDGELYSIDGSSYTNTLTYTNLASSYTHTITAKKEECISSVSSFSFIPIGLVSSSTNVTTTTAELSWSNPTSSTSWEIVVQSLGSTPPSSAGIPVSNNSYLAENLTPGTQYQYYVRSQCDSEVFSSWAGPYMFNTLICDPSNTCIHTFRMTDSANNGWNGATMEVRQNGIAIAAIGSTFTSGAGPIDIAVPLCKDMPFELYWSAAGTQPQQCSVSIINSFGQIIYTKLPTVGTTVISLYSGTVNCTVPRCDIAPVNLTAVVSTHSADLSWQAPATTTWDVYVVEKGSPAPTAATVPSYSNITSIPFTTIDPLLADRDYDFYVRVDCGGSEIPSAWSSVGTFHTIATCPKPTGLTASSITAISANLNWTPASPSDTLWDILLVPSPTMTLPSTLPPVNPSDPNQILLSGVVTPSPYTLPANTLMPATIYFYYIRTVCSGGGDIGAWAGPYVFNTVTCDPANKCNYKFVLTDKGGDGWNNGRIQVRQNGIVVATLGGTITGAGPTVVNVGICPDIPFDLYWSIAGTKPEEIGITVQNPFTDIIYSKGPEQGNPLEVLFSSTGNCTTPTCPKPTALTVVNITQTSADLSWTEMGSATQWEVCVVPTGTTPPVNGSAVTGVKPYYIANTNPFTVSDLLPSTSYTYYVRAICSSGSDIGTWTIISPKTFVTIPLNDECSGAISVPVNQNKAANLKVSGNTLGATGSLPASVCPGAADDDVWCSFTATSPTHIITLDNIVGATTDLNHTVYAGTDCAALTQLYCSSPNVSVAANLIPGNTYKIRVYTNGSIVNQSATFDISITTPPVITNDECATAIQIPVNTGMICKVSASGSLTGATASADSSTCIGIEDDDVWFSFVAASDTHYFTLNNVSGSSTDLNFGIYSGICGSLVQKYCSPSSALSGNTSGFVMGQTYYVRVWSSSSVLQDVTFDLCISKILPPVKTSTTAYTTEELVKKVLINSPCVTVSNITSSTGTDFGSVNGIGSFDGMGTDFPIANGLVLSTGNVLSVPGPNGNILNDGTTSWSGDDDLAKIVLDATGQPMNPYNASKLEFDFTSPNEFMSFNFLFAAEEYGFFQCNYTDSFAFLLTDLTTNVTTNLAVVPGTISPVSVVTVRNGNFNAACTSVNSDYFYAFYQPGFSGSIPAIGDPINYNGMTKLMTASSAIIPNHLYHIKLVIADGSDTQYDSAVFIQGGSFSSGPPECMDKIKLVAFIDVNANGVKDSEEENFTHGSFTLQKNNTGTLTNISAPDGSYTLYSDNLINTYDFALQVNQEYASYYSVTATNYNDINIPAGSGTQTLYFPVAVTQDYKDVSVTIVPVSEPVPGASYINKIVYTNLGTLTASGTVTFTKPDVATITDISQTGTALTEDGFVYNFTNLAPNETHTIDVTMSIPATVNINDVLTASATISASTSKSINGTIATDAFTNSQKVVAFSGTNEITEAHTEKIPFNSFGTDEYLTYTIRFKNTGTANATSVKIEDILDSKLDVQSLRMISASHNYVMERVGDKIVWHLDYINLVGSPQSEVLSKGYVTFKVKLLPGFAAGDIVPNYADIYFDANAMETTNTFNTEFTAQLAVSTFESNNVLLFPNPTSDMLQIRLQNSTETMNAIVIYDLLGKMVRKVENIAANQSNISVGSLEKGVYMVEITTQNNYKTTKKLIVQ